MCFQLLAWNNKQKSINIVENSPLTLAKLPSCKTSAKYHEVGEIYLLSFLTYHSKVWLLSGALFSGVDGFLSTASVKGKVGNTSQLKYERTRG